MLLAVLLVLGAGVWLGRRTVDRPSVETQGPGALSASATLSETVPPLPAPPSPKDAQGPSAPPAGPPAASVAVPPAPPASGATVPDITLPGEVALKDHFKSLTDANSAVYVVKPGDNLTRIAKQFGVTPGLIAAANAVQKDRIYPGQKLRVPKAKLSLLAVKSDHMLHLKADETVIRSYRIATGKDRSTPVGTFKIINHLKNPTWYHEGKVIPPDSPDNPLGTRWMGFDKEGYGLHGTTRPEEIGQFATLGCVRMLNEDIESLFELLPVGTDVTIIE